MKKNTVDLEEVSNLYGFYDTITRIPNTSWYPPQDGYHGCKDCSAYQNEILKAAFRVCGGELRFKFVPAKNIRESYILDGLEVTLNGKTYTQKQLVALCPWFTRLCLRNEHFWVSEALIQYYRQTLENKETRTLLEPVVKSSVGQEVLVQAVKTVAADHSKGTPA
jgi:hypothetical protein